MPAKPDIYNKNYQSQSARYLDDYEDDNPLPEPNSSNSCSDHEAPQLPRPSMHASLPRLPNTPTRSRFLSVPRLAEVLPSRAIVPQDQRPTDQGKLSKLREKAPSPLANAFNLIPLDDAAGQILNNYNLLITRV